MILPFSTQLNGKPTYFVEKILQGLYEKQLVDSTLSKRLWNPQPFERKGICYNIQLDKTIICKPKFHSFRKDEKRRWKDGKMINFYINNRQPNMYNFAPDLPVVSTQRIFMTYAFNDVIQISVDGRELFGYHEREQLAFNDGFDTWQDFFEYWYPIIKNDPDQCFSGKIIHWTDLKY